MVGGRKGSVYPLPGAALPSRALYQPWGLGAVGCLASATSLAVPLTPSGALPLVGLPAATPEAGCPPTQPGACSGQWSQAGEAPGSGPASCREVTGHTWETTDLFRFSISRSRHWWAHELHSGVGGL